MKGSNTFEFCEAQMCRIVEYWLKAKFSLQGDTCDSKVTAVKPHNGSFRVLIEEKAEKKEGK